MITEAHTTHLQTIRTNDGDPVIAVGNDRFLLRREDDQIIVTDVDLGNTLDAAPLGREIERVSSVDDAIAIVAGAVTLTDGCRDTIRQALA